jgi:hypothetical protein
MFSCKNPETALFAAPPDSTQVVVEQNILIFSCLHQKKQKQTKKIEKLVQTEKVASETPFP